MRSLYFLVTVQELLSSKENKHLLTFSEAAAVVSIFSYKFNRMSSVGEISEFGLTIAKECLFLVWMGDW